MVGLKQQTFPVGLESTWEEYLTLQNIQKYFSHAGFNLCAVTCTLIAKWIHNTNYLLTASNEHRIIHSEGFLWNLESDMD